MKQTCVVDLFPPFDIWSSYIDGDSDAISKRLNVAWLLVNLKYITIERVLTKKVISWLITPMKGRL